MDGSAYKHFCCYAIKVRTIWILRKNRTLINCFILKFTDDRYFIFMSRNDDPAFRYMYFRLTLSLCGHRRIQSLCTCERNKIIIFVSKYPKHIKQKIKQSIQNFMVSILLCFEYFFMMEFSRFKSFFINGQS